MYIQCPRRCGNYLGVFRPKGEKKILLKWRRGDLLFDFSRRDDTQSSPLNKKVDNQAIKKRDSWRWVGAHPLDCVGRASILFISLSILVLHGAIYFLASIVNHYQTGEEYVRNKLNVPAAVVVVLLLFCWLKVPAIVSPVPRKKSPRSFLATKWVSLLTKFPIQYPSPEACSRSH
jgi:hypothetical protein